MSDKFENPSAFPFSGEKWIDIDHGAQRKVPFVQEGMTLLDYFAGQYLSSMDSTKIKLIHKLGDNKYETLGDQIVHECYDAAEGMLKERQKRMNNE